jgi:hypothetical protein
MTSASVADPYRSIVSVRFSEVLECFELYPSALSTRSPGALTDRAHPDLENYLPPCLGSGIHWNSSFEKPSGRELVANGESTSIYQRVMTHWPSRFSSSAL